MIQTADQKDRYLIHFEEFEKGLNGELASPVHSLRKAAIGRFDRLGFPTRRDESWVHTSVASLAGIPFKSAAGHDSGAVEPGRIEPFTFGGCTQLVFVNGRYAPALSSHRPLPEGVRAGSLRAALDDDEIAAAHVARYAPYEEHAFAALNTAFIEDGAFLSIPEGVVLDEPVHLLFISEANGEPTVSHPRVLVLAGDNSRATVIESYAGLAGGPYFTNAVTEIVAGENAVIDHYKLELENLDAYHIATQQVHLGRSSNVTSHAISLGGGLVRNEVNALLAGEGCEATVNGFYLLEGRQHVDNHTLIEHAEPNCTSHELYKGILGGGSRGVFRGRIYVHRKAQKTDAYQTNQNLLLSDDAEANSKPQLEIYADDVKCSHGSTVGQMDENAVFYFRSRGIGLEKAHQILLHAFADDIIGRVRFDPVRRQLERKVMHKFDNARRVGNGI